MSSLRVNPTANVAATSGVISVADDFRDHAQLSPSGLVFEPLIAFSISFDPRCRNPFSFTTSTNRPQNRA
jgi:hypothetical protein